MFASNLKLFGVPLSGALLALAVGWSLDIDRAGRALPDVSRRVLVAWLWLIRTVAPAGVLFVLAWRWLGPG